MKTLPAKHSAVIRLMIFVVPVVLALVIGFLLISESVILNLSKDRMTLKSKNYSAYISTWAERIIGELNIYRDAVNKIGEMDDEAFDLMLTSYGNIENVPYGLYWGDENANFFDASGWDPGPEYIPAQRSWYSEGRTHEKFAFGDPYIDVRTGDACVSATAKLDLSGTKSVLAADVYFEYPEQLVRTITEQEIDRAFFVSGDSGMMIVNSDPQWMGQNISKHMEDSLYRGVAELIDSRNTGLFELKGNDGSYFVCINKISGMDWFFVTCMDNSKMFGDLQHVVLYIVIFGVAACAMLLLLSKHALKEFGEAEKQARTDPLTGLFNREGFRFAVRAALRNCPDQGVVIMIDVDNFKQVNDRLGHPEGDAFLKSFSALINEYFNRNKDITARLGGDEFAVFVGRKIDPDETNAMLNKFMRVFHKEYDEKYAEQNLSVSIGATFVGRHGNTTLADVYQSADKALYRAKNSGKDKFIVL